MSRGWKRYGEGRLYFIGGAVSLTVLLWSVLFAQDRAAQDASAAAAVPGTEGPAVTAPQAASSSAGVQTAAPTQAPHTRTRGS